MLVTSLATAQQASQPFQPSPVRQAASLPIKVEPTVGRWTPNRVLSDSSPHLKWSKPRQVRIAEMHRAKPSFINESRRRPAPGTMRPRPLAESERPIRRVGHIDTGDGLSTLPIEPEVTSNRSTPSVLPPSRRQQAEPIRIAEEANVRTGPTVSKTEPIVSDRQPLQLTGAYQDDSDEDVFGDVLDQVVPDESTPEATPERDRNAAQPDASIPESRDADPFAADDLDFDELPSPSDPPQGEPAIDSTQAESTEGVFGGDLPAADDSFSSEELLPSDPDLDALPESEVDNEAFNREPTEADLRRQPSETPSADPFGDALTLPPEESPSGVLPDDGLPGDTPQPDSPSPSLPEPEGVPSEPLPMPELDAAPDDTVPQQDPVPSGPDWEEDDLSTDAPLLYNGRDCPAELQLMREAWLEIRNSPITEISLDITPSIEPSKGPAGEAAAKEENLSRAPSRTWRNRAGEVLARGKLVDYRNSQVMVRDQQGQIQSLSWYDLGNEDLCFLSAWWELPSEYNPQTGRYQVRDWTMTTFTWKASAMCHKPLYFEEVQLERYGHTAGPMKQAVLSGVHFFGNIVFLPYHLGLNPPNECRYTLGYYRPGSCAPWLLPALPLDARAARMQVGALVGGLTLLP